MKKTISIHLMGTNFLVEEDAYELVHNYLERLKNSLKNSNDQKEICEDVELRIAELATALITEKKHIVTFQEMKQILDTLGQPEDFLDEEDQPQQEKTTESNTRRERRLFRDVENGVMAGVCSGLAAYFKVDVTVIRVVFVILGFAGGFVFPLYIIMWIVVPQAKTNVERLQMQGRPINLETLKEEFEDAAQRLSKSSKNFEREMSDKNSPIRKRINAVGNALGKLIGFGLLIFGCISMVALVIFGFIDQQVFPFESGGNLLNYDQFSQLVMVDESNAFFLWLGGLITGAAGVIFILLLGSVLLFKLRSKWIKRTFFTLVIVAVSGISICIYQGVRMGTDFAIAGEYETKIGDSADSTLHVNILNGITSNFVNPRHHYGYNGNVFEIKNGKIIESGIDIYYRLSEDSSFHVYAEYSALGRMQKNAFERSKNIQHEINLSGNQLTIAPYYKFPKTDKVRSQSVTLTIQIPQGKELYFKDRIVSSEDVKESGYIDRDGNYEHFDLDEEYEE